MTDLVLQSLAAGSFSPAAAEAITALNALTPEQGLTLTTAQAA